MATRPPTKKNTPRRDFFKRIWTSLRNKRAAYMERRPHRSFRRTRRRDIPKYAPLPGYFAFLNEVRRTMKRFRGAFAIFVLLYISMSVLMVGIVSQENYHLLTETFQTLGEEVVDGGFDTATQAFVLFGAAVTGGLNGEMTESQQIYTILLIVFTWLSVVWYLRHRLSGTELRVRDAVYNAGAPFIPTVIIGFVLLLQLIPGAIGLLIYTTADATGVLSGGVESMMFAMVAVLLCVLSLYWATSSFFAALIATIPGTYPFAALRLAGDVVLGRRLSVMLRLLWLGLALLVLWAIVLIPVIFIAGSIEITWLPLVPLTMQVLGALSVLIAAVYIYLLYRRMIDAPATN